MEKKNNISFEFKSYFEKNIKNNFNQYTWETNSTNTDLKRKVYIGIKEGNNQDVIFVKQIKIFFEQNNIENILKEIYFLILLKQSKMNYFSKLNEIKISDDKKYIFFIFRENKISLDMLMEYKYLKEENFIQYITFFICLELYYLYFNNIVHNDIKPSNILYGEYPLISLCDFGAMRYEGEISNEYTHYYAAPEYFYNNNKRNNKSDMWAVGIIMIEMFYIKNYIKNNKIFDAKEKKKCFQK